MARMQTPPPALAPPRPASTLVGVRVPPDMIGRIDALATQWSRPGFVATRSDVVRVLITQALAALDGRAP